MTRLVATLPMYDWPEVRGHTDRLWQRLGEAIADAGIAARADLPDGLSRRDDPFVPWRDPCLVLGQTCGLPFATRLQGQVTLVGSPAYAIAAAPGSYCSVIIAPAASGAPDPLGWEGMRFAYNDDGSQSGVAAWLGELIAAGRGLPRDFTAVRSGSHRQSVRCVADGDAELATIDAVSFELALRHEPAARRVRVLGRTAERPALPVITAPRFAGDVAKLQRAAAEAIRSLDGATRDALLLTGFVPRDEADYAPLRSHWDQARAKGMLAAFAA
ncbi:MAG: PhnD/SsuA/transferrin family substrate-binding protein [Nitratireductor sp.]|nr:PhnD/SsuA/transferrin family substrate-binding protein [Nitratireductor sp.]